MVFVEILLTQVGGLQIWWVAPAYAVASAGGESCMKPDLKFAKLFLHRFLSLQKMMSPKMNEATSNVWETFG